MITFQNLMVFSTLIGVNPYDLIHTIHYSARKGGFLIEDTNDKYGTINLSSPDRMYDLVINFTLFTGNTAGLTVAVYPGIQENTAILLDYANQFIFQLDRELRECNIKN